ncbi:hypothetical protein [Sessilibacter corallicola]|uniref:hypothetical protein n=1 Tax=Sessilibacter corallicola TaxID=2904075 RepID=UPI001E60C1AE|nr:hypothetical protein [Sessilibacter corallicola]MCE2028696.1 hypothetical protein [Sessilibacter corallicola]
MNKKLEDHLQSRKSSGKGVKKILWEEYSPIEIYEQNTEWSDEYNGYVLNILRLAIGGNDYIRITTLLTSAINQNIRLIASKNNTYDIKLAK